MYTLKLTKKDFKETNYYYKKYCGKTDVSNYDGNIEIDGNLGCVKFNSIKATGYIFAQEGTGIEAGEGIEAGWGIKAGEGIEAGWGIKAGEGIEAGWGIEAGEGIEAGWGIEAGEGIEAGMGIVGGLYIQCKLSLSAKLRIFAGVCCWRKIDDSEKTITCGKLESGEIAYGILKEIGLPEENKEQIVTMIQGDKKYEVKIVREIK